MTLKCFECGRVLTPEMDVCPNCGSRSRLIEVLDSVKVLARVRVREKAKGYSKFKREFLCGEKIGRNGKLARELRIIDKEKRWKYHTVEEKNERGEWVLVHKEDKPL
jgi:uncharacterized OB-fold protein